MKVIKCNVGKSKFAFPLGDIKEVIETVLYEEYLGQNKFTLGFINYRGDELQLLNIAKVLKGAYEKNKEYEDRFIIIAKSQPFCILVDNVEDIFDLEDEEIEKMVKESPFFKDGQTTLKRSESGFTFVNYNFETD